jgi:hypothetical protein
VSLREQFVPDLENTFMNTAEHATTREFRISDGQGGFRVFTAAVVWDEEQAKRQPVVSVHGIFLGDVICHIMHKYLPRMPVTGELIYSPANKPWEVLQCTDQEFMYVLALWATRSQPGKYGGN